MLSTLLFLSCQEKNQTVETVAVTDPRFQFSIAVIADPHITGWEEHSQRLEQTVQWINDQKESHGIDLVFVLGDVGWGEGLVESKQLLDQLSIPYIPVIGDNEVHFGDQENFGTVYGLQYEYLSINFEDWNKDGAAVWNPEEEENSWFYNFALSYNGLRLIIADWSARINDSILGEMGDLHDFDGGTWRFFEREVLALSDQKENSVFFLSHIPMYILPGAFDVAEAAQISGLTNAYSDLIYANFAGHFHLNVETELEEGGFDVFVTDAVWDDVITIRLVEVWENEVSFFFEQEMIEFEYAGTE